MSTSPPVAPADRVEKQDSGHARLLLVARGLRAPERRRSLVARSDARRDGCYASVVRLRRRAVRGRGSGRPFVIGGGWLGVGVRCRSSLIAAGRPRYLCPFG